MTQLAADVVLLDKILTHYGPETKEIRGLLRDSVARMLDVTWARDGSDKDPLSQQLRRKPSLTRFRSSLPDNDNQRFLQSQALSMAIKIGQTRSLMVAQKCFVGSYAVADQFWLSGSPCFS